MAVNKEIIRQVEDVYKWLDEQVAANRTAAGECGACGKCCDFEKFGHRLFVTTPEILYFTDKIGCKNHRAVARPSWPCFSRAGSPCYTGGRCCYQSENKCSVYNYRFASCRIFCCKGDARFQSDLTEAVVKKFKSLCDEFEIPYRYTDLPTALKEVSVNRKNIPDLFSEKDK